MRALALALILFLTALSTHAEKVRNYPLEYQVTFKPSSGIAEVSLRIPDSRWLKSVNFNVESGTFSNVKANGELDTSEGRWRWRPPSENAQLSYQVKINSPRGDGEFDALITDDWVLMRGDDLVPPARVRQSEGAQAQATVDFVLPKEWSSVNSEWERVEGNLFKITEAKRRFVRPTGWLIAGQLSTRHELMDGTQISISAPRGHDARPMETLVFLQFVWSELAEALDQSPTKILIVSAAEPMWRGGLSAPNSLYIHSERPLVSENGTSTLIHELVHVLGGISGAKRADWIAEGIAEYYAIELLARAGGLSEERKRSILAGLEDWGKSTTKLHKKTSSGGVTAKAVTVFAELDRELQKASGGEVNLDHLVRRLKDNQNVSLQDLQEVYRDLVGRDSKVLKSKPLQPDAD